MKTYSVTVERRETYVFSIESYSPHEAEEKVIASLYERDPTDSETDISVIEITDSIGKGKTVQKEYYKGGSLNG